MLLGALSLIKLNIESPIKFQRVSSSYQKHMKLYEHSAITD